MKKIVDPKNARSREYKEVIKTIVDKGQCPFCSDNFRYHKNPILKKSDGWIITESSWPYQNTQHHFIVLNLASHKENFSELTVNDFNYVRRLVNWATKKFRLQGGALAMRFGGTEWTGATVCHLHFHLIVPKKGKTVSFPIG